MVLVLGLSGCATCTSWFLPSHKLETKIVASRNVNPDYRGKPAPIMVSVYQLHDVKTFNSLDFTSLTQNPKKLLSRDFVSMKNFELVPGQTISIKAKVAAATRFIGVIAAYRQIDQTKWRNSIKLCSTWGAENLYITVHKLGVKLILK